MSLNIKNKRNPYKLFYRILQLLTFEIMRNFILKITIFVVTIFLGMLCFDEFLMPIFHTAKYCQLEHNDLEKLKESFFSSPGLQNFIRLFPEAKTVKIIPNFLPIGTSYPFFLYVKNVMENAEGVIDVWLLCQVETTAKAVRFTQCIIRVILSSPSLPTRTLMLTSDKSSDILLAKTKEDFLRKISTLIHK